MARARPISPFTLTAEWGQAGRHWPQRMQASSTTCSINGASPATAIASDGHTRTQARHATHSSASMTKFNGPGRVGTGADIRNLTAHLGRVNRRKKCKALRQLCLARAATARPDELTYS